MWSRIGDGGRLECIVTIKPGSESQSADGN